MPTPAAPLPTTTLGAFPNPSYVPVRDWFDISRESGGMNSSQTTTDFTAASRPNDAEHEGLFIRAAKEVIDIQLRAGITIPTDRRGAPRKLYPLSLPPPGRVLISKPSNTASCATAPTKPTCLPSVAPSPMPPAPTAHTIISPARASARVRPNSHCPAR